MSELDKPTDKNVINFLVKFAGKKESVLFFIVIFTMSILDLVGIAVIFPYMQIVTHPEFLDKFVNQFVGGYVPLKQNQILPVISFALIILYLAKGYMQSMLTRYQHRHLAHFTARLTDDTVSKILNSKYGLFQEIAGSEIAGMAYSNTVHATIAFRSLIQMANEFLFLALLSIAFLLISPTLTLSVLSLLCMVAIALYFFVVRRTSVLGKLQSQIENTRYRILFSIINAIRDIKVMGLASLFDAKNREISAQYEEIAWRYNYNGALPLLVIELVVLVGVVGSVSMLMLTDLPMDKVLSVIGVASVAAVRTVPAFAKLMMAFNSFRFSRSFVESLINIRERLDLSRHTRLEDALSFRQYIELCGISFRYLDKVILSNVHFKINCGQSVGIVGPSGSGKTTLLDIFTGLQPASGGNFLCDGQPFDPFYSRSMERFIGYVPQTLTLLDESVAFNITFEHKYDVERLNRALRIANLGEFVRALPDGVNSYVGENGLRLSGGQRQRIGIARALYREPEILVFDEATSALDAHTEKEITDEIAQLRGKVTMLIVSHRLSAVMDCNSVYVLAHGRIQDYGTHEELLERCDLYRELYMLQNTLA